MDDLVRRQDAIEAMCKWFCNMRSAQDDDFLDILDKLPSAQPEIVRCKDCKYSSPNGVYGCRLERYNFNDESVRMYGEDYCSYGERRIDE